MTDYARMEVDFIRRTLEIIDQYAELVRGRVDKDQEYEVTLLMNCLLGLLIYPQQIAHHRGWQQWLTQAKVTEAGPDYGIEPHFIRSTGIEKRECRCCGREHEQSIPLEEFTMRKLVRQMRNTAAHARFYVGDHSDNQGQITQIEFKDEEREDGFHLVIPVANLETFVRQLAQSALEQIGE